MNHSIVSTALIQGIRRHSAAVTILAVAVLILPAHAQVQVIVGPQVRIDTGGGTFAANETTVSVSEANPNVVVAGWNDWRRSGASEVINCGFSLSLNGGQSWSDFLVRPPAMNQSNVEGDPMTAFDDRTGTLWVGGISFSAGSNSGIYVAKRSSGAILFSPSVMARTTSGTDKGWMAAGPRPGLSDTTRLYITYNEGVIWSDDMGSTWTTPTTLGSGLGFLPRIGPDGELYVAYWNGGTGMMMKRSLNGGQNFTTHTVATRMDVWGTQSGSRFPGDFRAPSMLYLDVDQNTGTLYAVYFDTTDVVVGNSNVDLYFTQSADQGTTWTTPVVINNDLNPPGDQFFSWLEVDRGGRLHMVFFDSRNTAQDDNTIHGMFDAYYSFSADGGVTWTETRLTPNSWDSFDDGLNRTDQFIGDYLGLSVAGNRVYPVYLDTSTGDTDTYTNVIVLEIQGDMNCDGLVDTGDITPFATALVDPVAYAGDFPNCNAAQADMDGDALVDGHDIESFVACLLDPACL